MKHVHKQEMKWSVSNLYGCPKGQVKVFLSTHKDFIMVDCINGPGQIINYAEFDKLDIIPNNTYFSR